MRDRGMAKLGNSGHTAVVLIQKERKLCDESLKYFVSFQTFRNFSHESRHS